MVQCRRRSRFSAKALQSQRIFSEIIRQEFQRHKPAELSILGPVHHAHTASAQPFQNAVVREGFSDERVGIRHSGAILGKRLGQVNVSRLICSRKMRMSGLSKVEMSAFMDGWMALTGYASGNAICACG